ncbi:SH3 domain-containing protein [Rhodanobacter sp. MP1X3]|uniref:SH3 domain-containing protein n=1 Tax=Rhodanobacter sp. MP1X3 TaxID=2723086 RepID=UPI001611FC69|nr:SH3 domain-containing protein [Rhodanobacter sp. MP1X3]MBB6242188.1 uncharacterized protein YraI [Rhodanobacter sp. MP1X3]
MKRKLWSSLAVLCLAAPVCAYAAEGYVVDNVNLRAGPDPSYPLVDQLPTGTEVDVQGCTNGWEWCDVINEGDGSRGWIPGGYIQYEYQDQQVLLPEYGEQIGIPIVAFSIGAYWDRYYRSRPFYGQRANWYNRPYVSRPPSPPSHGPYPGRPGGSGQWHGPNGNYGGQPGAGYQRPGRLGPVSPGYPERAIQNGQSSVPQRGQGPAVRPGTGQPATSQGRPQPQAHPTGHPEEHHDNDHNDDNGH